MIDKNRQYNLIGQEQLLPIPEIIRSAKKIGAAFGHGDPKIHLAYLTKLRLLPQTVRRKIGTEIVGCYPTSVISQIKQIEDLKSTGRTYSQIRSIFASQTIDSGFSQTPKHCENASFTLPSFGNSANFVPHSNSLVFLIIGLILGYLLSISSVSQSKLSLFQNRADLTDNSIESLKTLDTQSSQMIQIQGSSNGQNQPIYLIAVPKQNFEKLGTTNISKLINY